MGQRGACKGVVRWLFPSARSVRSVGQFLSIKNGHAILCCCVLYLKLVLTGLSRIRLTPWPRVVQVETRHCSPCYFLPSCSTNRFSLDVCMLTWNLTRLVPLSHRVLLSLEKIRNELKRRETEEWKCIFGSCLIYFHRFFFSVFAVTGRHVGSTGPCVTLRRLNLQPKNQFTSTWMMTTGWDELYFPPQFLFCLHLLLLSSEPVMVTVKGLISDTQRTLCRRFSCFARYFLLLFRKLGQGLNSPVWSIWWVGFPWSELTANCSFDGRVAILRFGFEIDWVPSRHFRKCVDSMRTSDALRGVSCLNDHRFMSEALFLSMADLFVFFSVKFN